MASAEIGHTVLMSIHPPYAQFILQGRKQAEFRKKRLSPRINLVLIYATRPVGRIVGAFRINEQKTDEPERIWDNYWNIGCIERDLFFKYFSDSLTGTAIVLGDVFRLTEAISLELALGFTRPPQSFQYVDQNRADQLLSQMVRI